MSVEMNNQKTSPNGTFLTGPLYTYEEELSSPGNGEWIIVPRGSNGISVVLSSTGDGRVEVALTSRENVEADTVPNEALIVWTHGNIGVDTKHTRINGVMAFRQVNISGTTTISAVGDE